MVRKVAGALIGDIWSFLTGSSMLSDYSDLDNRWLHPIDCSAMIADPDRHFGPFDANGLPMQALPGIGTVYVPSRTAAFGFAHWNAMCLGEGATEAHRARFLTAAHWFAAFPDGRITHDFPLLNLSAPWLSALAQGEALSIFARAFTLARDSEWHDRIKDAAHWLSVAVDDGGVLGTLPDGRPFLEEYPGTRHCNVLNGCLYALAGLNDAAEIGAIERDIVDRIADAVEANLSILEPRRMVVVSVDRSRGENRQF
jgi:heparosan-N-sulfate-glucuronate 5-epimerase